MEPETQAVKCGLVDTRAASMGEEAHSKAGPIHTRMLNSGHARMPFGDHPKAGCESTGKDRELTASIGACGRIVPGSEPPSETELSSRQKSAENTGCCWSFAPEGKPMKLFIKAGEDDSVDYGEGSLNNLEKTVWESLPQPIIIDSGASTSVLPLSWCAHVQTKETEASRRGEHYTAANGGKIYNKGEKVVTMMSREGHLRNMKFTSCDVERALGSVSAICRQGNTVVFNAPDHPDGSYIYNLHSGERMELQHKDGVFVLDTRVAPSNRQLHPSVGQGR